MPGCVILLVFLLNSTLGNMDEPQHFLWLECLYVLGIDKIVFTAVYEVF
jgi:hypothetical protein